jgi:hypothetical protein
MTARALIQSKHRYLTVVTPFVDTSCKRKHRTTFCGYSWVIMAERWAAVIALSISYLDLLSVSAYSNWVPGTRTNPQKLYCCQLMHIFSWKKMLQNWPISLTPPTEMLLELPFSHLIAEGLACALHASLYPATVAGCIKSGHRQPWRDNYVTSIET